MTDAAAGSRDNGVLRRAKPLLGTLVDIGIGSADAVLAREAAEAAFAEILDVHRLMSFHKPQSDVSRINRAAPGEPVEVDARTADVLRLAIEIHEASSGAFDCTIAPVLQRHRLLPPLDGMKADMAYSSSGKSPDDGGGPAPGCVPALMLDARFVIKRRDCLIDLGGIAKGYAVDRAVDAILAIARASGDRLESVLVNAGGDLRFHGRSTIKVRLRDPGDPARLDDVVDLSDGALASSSTCGLNGIAHGVSSLVDPLSGEPLPAGAGVTITAPTCTIADALTKVALATGDPAHPIFARYGASVAHFVGRRRSHSVPR